MAHPEKSQSEFVTQAQREAGTLYVHGERLGQFIFKSGLIRLKPSKLGDKAQIIGDGFFKANKALEGNGVLEELADIEVGVTVQAPEVKIDTGIPQADAAKDGDVQAKLLPGNRVEENGFNRAGGIGRDRTELRKFS